MQQVHTQDSRLQEMARIRNGGVYWVFRIQGYILHLSSVGNATFGSIYVLFLHKT